MPLIVFISWYTASAKDEDLAGSFEIADLRDCFDRSTIKPPESEESQESN